MLDAKDRQALADKLKGKIRKASSNITTKFEAEKGDFKIVLTSDSITQLYKNNKVAEVKSAELDAQDLEFINSDPTEAASDMLKEFMETYKPQDMQVTASTQKEAANKAVDEETWTRTTEKQLTDKKVSLHPRQNEFHNITTEKQLPKDGQRPGTYDVTTEGQLREERNNFYGDSRVHDWHKDDLHIVTEKQINEGDAVVGDRGEVGAIFDGGLENQHYMTGEKQLIELLSHHEWKEPKTTTQGKDQLGKQDGELSRVTAEVAQSIIKEALNALGNTVLSVGITPQDLSAIVNKLISHKSKHPVLANTISQYKEANLDIEQIMNKVAKARYFGKTANTNKDWPSFVAADVLVRQLAKMPFSSKFIVDGLVAMASTNEFVGRIDETANNILSSKEEIKVAADENHEVFKKVLSGVDDCACEGSADADGMYAYLGSIAEVNENPDNQQLFSEAALAHAKVKVASKIDSKIELIPQTCEVNKAKGVFEVKFKDASFAKDELSARAAARQEMLKTAQFGGPGGSPPPGGGGDMGSPGLPAGPAAPAAGAPPETLTAPTPPAEDPMTDDGGTGEAQPPGSVCGACGSKDVDVDNGEIRCNACGAQGTITINTEWKKWPNVLNETGTEGADKAGFGLDEPGIGSEDAGTEMGDPAAMDTGGSGTTMPTPPIGASIKITPFVMQKLAEQKIPLGSICPNCGSKETDVKKAANSRIHNGFCWTCQQEYGFQVKATKGKKHQVFAQYTWLPKSASCTECTRSLQSPLKVAFMQSLANYGMPWSKFDALSSNEQADVILKMSSLGVLDLNTGLKNELPVKKFAASSRWEGYSKFDKFPIDSCIERLARRFGENATSMSGPCQGKKLANCVCGQLDNLGIYTDGLAAKVASMQINKKADINSPVEACVEMFMKEKKYTVKQACTVCDSLRAAYASVEDLIVESISELTPKSAQMLPAPAAPGMSGATAPSPAMMPAAPVAPPAPKPMEVPQPSVPPMPKPMDGSGDLGGGPMDGPAGLDSGPAGLGGDPMGGDAGLGGELDTSGPMDVDMGLGGDTVTLKLPADLANSLEQTLSILQRALGGDIGGDMIDDFGGDLNGPGDELGGDVGGELGSNEGPGGELSSDSGSLTDDLAPTDDAGDSGGDSEIPGLSDDSGSDLEKEGDPEPSSSPDSGPSDSAPSEKSDNPFKKEDSGSEKSDEGDSETKEMPMENQEQRQASLYSILDKMKTGTIRTSRSNSGSLFDGLIRQAELAAKTAKKSSNDEIKKVEYKTVSEEKIKATATQDGKEVGKYQDGGKIQNEEPFSKGVTTKVDVPRGDALMGSESSENKLNEKENYPKIPSGGDGKLKNEVNDVKSEQTNVLDGNQGRLTTATTAKKACKCGDGDCKCDCKNDSCGKPCMAHSKETTKKASTDRFVVDTKHKYYDAFMKKAESGSKTVKLTNGNTYQLVVAEDKKIILTAEEGKSVEPKKVEDGLSKDKDIGPVQNDKVHSLSVDEKKPSEGMNKPEIPEAPNGGRLTNEEVSEKAADGPTIPTGGGMNPKYDQNENYKPEKTDEMLGITHPTTTAGTVKQDEVVKIAGQMLKANLITVDELNTKIAELSKATPELLKNIETLLSGPRPTTTKTASAAPVNQILMPNRNATEGASLKDSIQSMFKLDSKNKLHEQFRTE